MRLHGKGGTGSETVVEGDVTVLSPDGNAEGWGGRQWRYESDTEYAAALAVVTDAVDGCDEIIVGGFSNGAAFAAAMFCRGVAFDGRVVGFVIDDPVPDHGADACAPDSTSSSQPDLNGSTEPDLNGSNGSNGSNRDIAVTLYWTGALADAARPGADCTELDWTCAGGETIGIDAYAALLGTPIEPSPHTAHEPYTDAPALTAWP